MGKRMILGTDVTPRTFNISRPRVDPNCLLRDGGGVPGILIILATSSWQLPGLCRLASKHLSRTSMSSISRCFLFTDNAVMTRCARKSTAKTGRNTRSWFRIVLFHTCIKFVIFATKSIRSSEGMMFLILRLRIAEFLQCVLCARGSRVFHHRLIRPDLLKGLNHDP